MLVMSARQTDGNLFITNVCVTFNVCISESSSNLQARHRSRISRNILRSQRRLNRANFLFNPSTGFSKRKMTKGWTSLTDSSFYISPRLLPLEKGRLATARFYTIFRIVAKPADPYTLRGCAKNRRSFKKLSITAAYFDKNTRDPVILLFSVSKPKK